MDSVVHQRKTLPDKTIVLAIGFYHTFNHSRFLCSEAPPLRTVIYGQVLGRYLRSKAKQMSRHGSGTQGGSGKQVEAKLVVMSCCRHSSLIEACQAGYTRLSYDGINSLPLLSPQVSLKLLLWNSLMGLQGETLFNEHRRATAALSPP